MPTEIEMAEFRRATLTKIAWRLIPFMIVLYFVAFLDRVNVSFAALTMNKDLSLSAAVYGAGAGIFFLGYFLFEIPSNLLLEKFGARIWIARIMIVWGLVASGMALVSGEKSFYVLRFLLGLAEAGFFPGMILYLTYWFPAAYRAKVVGAFLIAVPLSSVVGAPLSTAILSINGLGLTGWQWLFILQGIPAVLLGLAVLAYMTDKPSKAAWLTDDEKAWLEGVLAAERHVRESVHGSSLMAAFLKPQIWGFCAMYGGAVVGLYGLGLWLPQIIKGFGGISNFGVGIITMVPYASAAAAMYLWGRHSDSTGERVWHVALPAFVGCAGLAASAYLGDAPLSALIAITAAMIGIYAFLPVFWTLPTAILSGTAAAGAIAMINSIGNLGGYFGPTVLGYFKDLTHSFTYGLLFLSSCIALSGVLALIVGHDPKLEGRSDVLPDTRTS